MEERRTVSSSTITFAVAPIASFALLRAKKGFSAAGIAFVLSMEGVISVFAGIRSFATMTSTISIGAGVSSSSVPGAGCSTVWLRSIRNSPQAKAIAITAAII